MYKHTGITVTSLIHADPWLSCSVTSLKTKGLVFKVINIIKTNFPYLTLVKIVYYQKFISTMVFMKLTLISCNKYNFQVLPPNKST